jgi:hypothetical protein
MTITWQPLYFTVEHEGSAHRWTTDQTKANGWCGDLRAAVVESYRERYTVVRHEKRQLEDGHVYYHHERVM